MDHRRTTTRRLLAVVTAGLLLFAAAGCGSSDDDSDSGDDTTDTTAAEAADPYGGGGSSDEPSDAPAEATAPVISDFTFVPDPIEIEAGDTVTWTNEDGFAHTVSAEDDSFDSGNLNGGDTFEHTFDDAGDFAYQCNIHPQMTGTVTVNA